MAHYPPSAVVDGRNVDAVGLQGRCRGRRRRARAVARIGRLCRGRASSGRRAGPPTGAPRSSGRAAEPVPICVRRPRGGAYSTSATFKPRSRSITSCCDGCEPLHACLPAFDRGACKRARCKGLVGSSGACPNLGRGRIHPAHQTCSEPMFASLPSRNMCRCE